VAVSPDWSERETRRFDGEAGIFRVINTLAPPVISCTERKRGVADELQDASGRWYYGRERRSELPKPKLQSTTACRRPFDSNNQRWLPFLLGAITAAKDTKPKGFPP
jgi:hypothetical protein